MYAYSEVVSVQNWASLSGLRNSSVMNDAARISLSGGQNTMLLTFSERLDGKELTRTIYTQRV